MPASIDWFAWVGLPIIIFFARICDVTIGTLRIILVARGQRKLAPVLGFFEVFIWIVAISQLMQHIGAFTAYIGYAAGFATGNYVGMWLEEKLALGRVVVRVIVPSGADELRARLAEAGFGVTSLEGQGAQGPVKVIYTIVDRRALAMVFAIIHATHPGAFASVEDLRATEKGVFPASSMPDILSIRKSK